MVVKISNNNRKKDEGLLGCAIVIQFMYVSKVDRYIEDERTIFFFTKKFK
jgi:hypothetical protein